MNLALSSIILFLVILPGIVFKSSYLSSTFSRRIVNRKLIDDMFWAILPALILHSFAITFINSLSEKICKVEVNIDFLLRLSTTSKNLDLSPISHFPVQIIFYNVVLILVSFIIGHTCRNIVRHYKWDRNTKLFRFSNKWYYVFSGELLDFPDIPDESSDVDLVLLDFLCDVQGESVIYTGKYMDHTLNKEGDLENILIKFPLKKKFESKDNFIEIPSKFFLIPYSTVKNLNVRYFSIDEVFEDEKSNTSDGSEDEDNSNPTITDAIVVE